MPHICADAVKETTTSTGTSNLTLAGAVSGFRSFGSVCANADTFFYRVQHQTANEWEIALGSYVSATPAISRTAANVLAGSSGAGTLVNFSAGTKDVMIVSPAIAQSWGALQPATITADQNDYNPPGLAFANVLRVAADRPYRSITGLAGGFDGRRIAIEGVGSYPLLLRAQNTGSAAANRFALATDVVLWPNDVIEFEYDAAAARWEPEAPLTAYDRIGWQQALVFEDEFLGGGTELGEQGQLGWFNTASGTAVYTTTFNGVAGHIGVIELQTGTTSGNAHGMQLGQAATNGIARAQDILYTGYLVAIPTITTVTVRIGVAQDATSATHGTDGYWFEFDPAGSANWRVNTRASSTSGTLTDTGVAVTAGNWYLLEAFQFSSSDLQFYINGSRVATFTSNIPTTVAVTPSFRVTTNTTAARNLRIDWFKMRIANMGNRWT
ncbi:MAG: LamG domain-containing protein [Steroidobacteraceae bacterium]|nr:LamG domain-containing protein [Steroidobacteraceae bacterium]MDW8260849.1 hypothetical protein [Gammaproteobacteria bacterium]